MLELHVFQNSTFLDWDSESHATWTNPAIIRGARNIWKCNDQKYTELNICEIYELWTSGFLLACQAWSSQLKPWYSVHLHAPLMAASLKNPQAKNLHISSFMVSDLACFREVGSEERGINKYWQCWFETCPPLGNEERVMLRRSANVIRSVQILKVEWQHTFHHLKKCMDPNYRLIQIFFFIVI